MQERAHRRVSMGRMGHKDQKNCGNDSEFRLEVKGLVSKV